MNSFKLHTIKSAPVGSASTLETILKNFGFTPNIFAVLAESPSAVKAYLQLGKLMEESAFTPEEQQVIFLAVNVENGCAYCVAAHSFVACNVARTSDDTINGLRNASVLPDAKLNALAEFTRAVVRERGWVADSHELNDFFAVGYAQQHMLEVVLGVAMKTLANYVNHIADTPIDAVFVSEKWK